ncbi:hypothetical protein AB4Y95_00165 [Arthrobacter sp. M-10]|uniref:hypothetical protein n=1 Tax=Arthrobacter sp. M-10 TaxID=3233037 RepID=UPI003F93CE9F
MLNHTAMGTVYTAVPCLFLPMSAQAAIQNGYSVGFAWNIYVDDGTDIQIGDKLTWNSVTYLVRGRQPFTGLQLVSHLKISAETERTNGQ